MCHRTCFSAPVGRTLISFLSLFQLLTSVSSKSQSIVKLSRVISVGPNQMDTFQTVNFFLYSLDMIGVTVITNSGEVDEIVDKTTYFSLPIEQSRGHQYHGLVIQYKYPYEHEKATKQNSIRITFQARVCGRAQIECKANITEQLEHQIRVINVKQIYQIEVERKTYGRGETVHFTLIHIPFEYLYQNMGGGKSEYGGPKEILIEKVAVQQSDHSVVCVWTDLRLVDSLHLNCSIPLESFSGTWTIDLYEKYSDSPTVTQSFHVLQSAYPVPTVQIVHSNWERNPRNLTRIRLYVCANESDGNPIHGEMKVFLCPCPIEIVNPAHGRVLSKISAADSWWIVKTESCFRDTMDGLARPCAVDYAVAGPDGCGSFRLRTESLNAIDRSNQSPHGKLLVCVRVYDGIRGAFHSKCFTYTGPTKLSTILLYKYGLPTRASVQLDPWRWSNRQLIGRMIEQRPKSCLAKIRRNAEPTKPRFHRLIHMNMDSTGHTDLIISPIFGHYDVKLKFEQ
ncbi:hypothetical protein D915_010683, partial [Fasciola hepatica]